MIRQILVGLVLFVAVLFSVGGISDAEASGYPCEPPSHGGYGPCYAEFWAFNVTATFMQDGFWLPVLWNWESYNHFYGFPQSGHEAELISTSHRVYTTYFYPQGTFYFGLYTELWGTRFNIINCFQILCRLSYLGPGPWPTHYNEIAYAPRPYGDTQTRVRAGGSIYPQGGNVSFVSIIFAMNASA